MIVLDEIVLRKVESHDLPWLFQYKNDPEIAQQLGGFSTGYSTDDLERWRETHRNRNDEVLWTIALKDSDRCIGHVGLYRIDHRIGKAEFAILLGSKEHHGKGIGRKVSRAVLDYGFRQLNLHKITMDILVTNPIALGLYESMGLKRDGVLRAEQYRDGAHVDVVVLSMLRGEWEGEGLDRPRPSSSAKE